MGRLIDYLRLTIDYFFNTKSSIANYSEHLDRSHLNCRVLLNRKRENNSVFNAFNVQIAGSIRAFRKTDEPTLRIFLTDVTDVPHRFNPIHWFRTLYKSGSAAFGQLVSATRLGDSSLRSASPKREAPSRRQATARLPCQGSREVRAGAGLVQSRVKRWQKPNSSAFCYTADLGKLPNQTAILSDWTTVANLNLDWLVFPRRGKRKLQFIASILSGQDGQEIAGAKCFYLYENPEFGYIDLPENIQRTKTLTVALAFAVSAADRKLYDCEIELIKNWAGKCFNVKEAANKARLKLEKAMEKTIGFFSDGNQLNINEICKELAEIASISDRYDALDLCLRVACAKGSVVAEELTILKNLAGWLKVDADKFGAMMEKTLPVNMHQVKDVEFILGVTSDMSEEKTRQQLNKQFSKWHSRVTCSDPRIRARADQMLKLIANIRNQYIG